MVTVYSSNPIQINLLELEMDKAGITYEVKQSTTDDIFMIVDGVPIDFDHALKWIYERIDY